MSRLKLHRSAGAVSGLLCLVVAATTVSMSGAPSLAKTVPAPDLYVAPQYDTTHVYVAPGQVDRFVSSILATFGGTSTKQVVVQVTPTPSSTSSQLLLTPYGSISVFGFRTPVPYPFGAERTGYFVRDMDKAVDAARGAGADIQVATFPDPIGRDTLVQWPGGVNMQLYSHTTPPSYPVMQTIPENRVYVSPGRAASFIQAWLRFSHGHVVSDDASAPGIEIGRPNDSYRRVRLVSGFGRLTLLVTDGHLPSPFGRELTGYEVPDLGATLGKAKGAGANILVQPFDSDGRRAAMVEFPGGYVAEIHAATP